MGDGNRGANRHGVLGRAAAAFLMDATLVACGTLCPFTVPGQKARGGVGFRQGWAEKLAHGSHSSINVT